MCAARSEISSYTLPDFSEQLFCVVTVMFESRVGEVDPSFVVRILSLAGAMGRV